MRGAVSLLKYSAPILMAVLLQACGPTVSGEVRDAGSEQPIPQARVDLIDVGWGQRDGQLVWDAEKRASSTSGADGRFAFNETGGGSLRVAAPGGARVEARLCSRSPTIVRVGGPYPDLRADRRLIFNPDGAAASATDKSHPLDGSADDLGLRGSGSAFKDGRGLRIEADGGVQFVEGTGAIPPPPPLPYDRVIELDLGAACGWLFVHHGEKTVAVIEVAPLGWEQDPGQPRRYVMLYTPLPPN